MALIAMILVCAICVLVLGNLAFEPAAVPTPATPVPQLAEPAEPTEPIPGYRPEDGVDVRTFSDAEVQNLIRLRPDEVVIEASGAVRWREWRGEKQFDGNWRCVRWR